ncbi:hypothetical protein ABZ540_35370 [Nocardia xishanensis]|uniref:hypothetical protein n=1 Tax=Nocardia xishanensis TaxID=238964 RepID=UPI003404CC23
MGTRGFISFVAGGQEKTTYNHSDSYPNGLGLEVLGWLRTAVTSLDVLTAKITNLLVVDPDSTPTPAQIDRLRQYADLAVSQGSLDDWYCLLRNTQGDPEAILDAGVIEDASSFPLDSLWAEYGYLIDTDTSVFETYVGGQIRPHDRGRFAHRRIPGRNPILDTYYPVALVASWPLNALPTDKAFLDAFSAD